MKMKLTAIKTVIMDKVSLSSLEIFDATAMIWIQTMHAEVMKKNFYVKFFLDKTTLAKYSIYVTRIIKILWSPLKAMWFS